MAKPPRSSSQRSPRQVQKAASYKLRKKRDPVGFAERNRDNVRRFRAKQKAAAAADSPGAAEAAASGDDGPCSRAAEMTTLPSDRAVTEATAIETVPSALQVWMTHVTEQEAMWRERERRDAEISERLARKAQEAWKKRVEERPARFAKVLREVGTGVARAWLAHWRKSGDRQPALPDRGQCDDVKGSEGSHAGKGPDESLGLGPAPLLLGGAEIERGSMHALPEGGQCDAVKCGDASKGSEGGDTGKGPEEGLGPEPTPLLLDGGEMERESMPASFAEHVIETWAAQKRAGEVWKGWVGYVQDEKSKRAADSHALRTLLLSRLPARPSFGVRNPPPSTMIMRSLQRSCAEAAAQSAGPWPDVVVQDTEADRAPCTRRPFGVPRRKRDQKESRNGET